jgi:hypothetical protein
LIASPLQPVGPGAVPLLMDLMTYSNTSSVNFEKIWCGDGAFGDCLISFLFEGLLLLLLLLFAHNSSINILYVSSPGSSILIPSAVSLILE